MKVQWEILAGVRFFLAWVVACSHLQHFVPENDLLVKFKEFSGFSAVLGFLLISGFSIAHSVSKNSQGFYWRRFVRIYPLYFCSIIVSVLPFALFSPKIISLDSTEYIGPSIFNLLGNLMFAQNFILAPLPSNGVVWTLGVEVVCYLLAPFLVKLNPSKILLVIGISSFSFLIYQLIGSPLGKDIAFLRYGLPFLFLVWAWLLGFLLFLCPQRNSLKIFIIALGTFILNISLYGESRLYIFTYILVSLVLIYPPTLHSQTLLKILKYLGEISYPLYLFHSSAFIVGYAVLAVRSSTVLMLLSIFISMVFYHLVDLPLRQGRMARLASFK